MRLVRSTLLLAGISSCLCGCSFSLGDAILPPSEPVIVESLADYNLILITVDALRPDHLRCYGYAYAQTPAIDSLATNGLRFTDAYANSSFLGQSLSALVSGRLPTSGGTVDILGAHPHDETSTMAQHFQSTGRATALMTNQPLLKSQGFTKGYEDVSISAGNSAKTAAEVTEDALTFVEDVAGDPFFLHVHYAEPHEPYGDSGSSVSVRAVREDYAAFAADDKKRTAAIAELKQRYDAEVVAVDAAVRQLMTGLKEQGVADRTAIVFTATHGEEFWEHDYVGHAWTLYDEVLLVPLILHAPGRVPAGTMDSTVSLVDVLPSLQTIFEDGSGSSNFDGASMFAKEDDGFVFRRRASPVIAELVLRDRCVLRAVIEDGWKYVAVQHSPEADARGALLDEPLPLWETPAQEWLFDLREDSGERQDLSKNLSDQLALLRETLTKYRADCEEHGVPPRDLSSAMEIGDTEDRESLETLGYL